MKPNLDFSKIRLWFAGNGQNRPPRHGGPLRLERRRIYIFPTRHGVMFGFILLTMLLGSINYNNNMGFVLCFLLGSMGTVSILHTYRNLAGLYLEGLRAGPVFAGEVAHFPVWLDNRDAYPRYALVLERTQAGQPGAVAAAVNLEPNARQPVLLAVPTARRGWLRLGRLTLSSTFPLGLFRAWTHLDLDLSGVVYPQPAGRQELPPGRPEDGYGGQRLSQGSDDFYGHRGYIAGDSPRHIDWKAAARERGWLIKQFDGESSVQIWLEWQHADVYHNPEATLAQLCRWVLNADARHLHYGLQLPGLRLEPGLGLAHRQRCLETLALYGSPP